MNFLIAVQIASVLITATGIILALVKPMIFIRYCYVFFTVIVSVYISTCFFNLGIYAVDEILIGKVSIEKYQEIFESMRKLIFPGSISLLLFAFQLYPLVILYKKIEKSKQGGLTLERP
jgi:hypothetical protein